MSDYDFEVIAAAETRPLRRALLHPGLAPEAVDYPGDTHPAVCHLGSLKDGVLVGIGTIHPQPIPAGGIPTAAWRVRDLAVEHGHRGRGIGALLLERLLEHASDHEGVVAWGAVRTTAAGFFTRCGFSAIDTPWSDPNEGDQQLMHSPIRPLHRSWGI